MYANIAMQTHTTNGQTGKGAFGLANRGNVASICIAAMDIS
jgi:hypothetical protein